MGVTAVVSERICKYNDVPFLICLSKMYYILVVFVSYSLFHVVDAGQHSNKVIRPAGQSGY